jgi:hypothetical protein
MERAVKFNELPFYARYSWFLFRERFTDVASSIAYLMLYPFFIWLMAQIWGKFNAYQGHYERNEIYIYVSITELLFMTFLRSSFLQRSNADFSLTLARPRSYLMLTFSGQFGTTLGGRMVYALFAMVILHLLGVPTLQITSAYLRLLLLIPMLGILEALMASFLATTQIVWHEMRYLVLPITKIFLALGGVFGPLADYGEPGRSIFLKLPASDLFFQVGHFCVKGSFYEMSAWEWTARISAYTVLFLIVNQLFYRFARTRHQAYGG